MKKFFFTGIATLLPLALTFWIVSLIVNFLTKPFVGWTTSFLTRFPALLTLSDTEIRTLSQILILLFLFLFTLILGFVGRRFFFHQLLSLGDRILKKIPLVNKVYKTSKELVESLLSTDKTQFKQVVLLSFPYEGSYCVGIITSSSPEMFSKDPKEKQVSVFIPTTPNPSTGFLVTVPEKELIFLDMKGDEAIKYIVSCAVIQPPSRGAS